MSERSRLIRWSVGVTVRRETMKARLGKIFQVTNSKFSVTLFPKQTASMNQAKENQMVSFNIRIYAGYRKEPSVNKKKLLLVKSR